MPSNAMQSLVLTSPRVNAPSYNAPSYRAHKENDAPHHHPLVLQDAVNQVILDFQGVKVECDTLRAENAKLQSRIATLEQKSEVNNVDGHINANGNFTGYASSEISYASSSAAEEAHAEPNPVQTQEMLAYEDRVDKKLKPMQEILLVLRDDSENLTTEHRSTFTDLQWLKERTDLLEHNLSSFDVVWLREDVEEARQLLANGSASPEVLAALMNRMDDFQGMIEDVQQGRGIISSEAGDDAGLAGIIEGADVKSVLNALESKVRVFIMSMKKQAEQCARIDSYNQREDLYKAFHTLQHDGLASKEQRTGQWKGDEADLQMLFERVVRRLAMFDNYTKAFKEAKDARVDVFVI